MAFTARGVGHNDEAFASMMGSQAGRGYNAPLRVIPDIGKFSNNDGSSHREMSSDVLQNRIAWSKRANGISDPRPQAPRVVGSLSFPGKAERLTRVASANNVGSFDGAPVDLFDISMIRDLLPMLAKYPASVRVDF
jgi:hypothetical protein